MSRTTRLNTAITAALYSKCDTMTIETQVMNKTKYDYNWLLIYDLLCTLIYKVYTRTNPP